MTITERQLTLETRMYRNKSFGCNKICKACFASTHVSCIATTTRSKQCLCAKAEARIYGPRFGEKNKKYKPKLGLRRQDYDI